MTDTPLAKKRCRPCEENSPPLSCDEAEELFASLNKWLLNDGCTRLTKRIKTKDFADSMAVANRVAAIAEKEGHHPDLHVSWGMLVVQVWTHSKNGLSENDFILAAKIDELQK